MKNSYHIYADDTQIYFKMTPGDYSPITTLSKCIEQINDWMTFGAKEERLKVIAELQSADYKTTNKARNLGVVMDSDLNFNSQLLSLHTIT